MTTDEMDGIFTEKDKLRQDSIYLQCFDCSKWTNFKHYHHNMKLKCINCGNDKFDITSMTSERSFNPLNKRKVRK